MISFRSGIKKEKNTRFKIIPKSKKNLLKILILNLLSIKLLFFIMHPHFLPRWAFLNFLKHLKNIKNLLKKGGKRVSGLKEEYKILPAARDNIKIKFILEELLKYSKIEIDSTLLTFIQEKSLPKTALDSPKWELLILKILKFLTFYWTRLSTFIAWIGLLKLIF